MTSSPTEATPSASPSSRWRVPALSLIILGVVGGGAFAVGIGSDRDKELAPTSAPSRAPTPAGLVAGVTHEIPPGAGALDPSSFPPADAYVAPEQAGTGDGSAPGNAAGLDGLNAVIAGLAPGGTVELIGDAGEYHVTSAITISTGGTADAPITIRGPIDGPAPVFHGDRSDPYEPSGAPGAPVFRLVDGADHLRFANLRCVAVGNGCFLIAGPITDLTLTAITGENVRRLIENGSADSGSDATISGLDITNVVVVGFSKGAIRLGHDTHDVTISDVYGDSARQNGDNFAIGLHLVDTVHDVVIANVAMVNAHDTLHPYWNGDGFAVEPGTHDIDLIDTSASGNTDAGYDLKGTRIHLIDVSADDNKRNFRFAGAEIIVEGCLGTQPTVRGGTGSQAQVQMSGSATVEMVSCNFVDSSPATVVFDIDELSRLVLSGGSVVLSADASVSIVDDTASLDLGSVEITSP